ncbi:hypothetical protein H0H87_005430 [Tephrocybe sp. NHM501043]|nr:hypothetical protein H0H87_005430 [Tephrocybe sp. NHM501043]
MLLPGRLKKHLGVGLNSTPELTPTALLLGLVIGCLVCFTNLSLGLQSGWISMMSIQSALIGFLVSRMLPVPLTPQEIIVVQTTAVATGTMPLAAGFVGILPALTLLSEERDGTPPIHLTWLSAIGWSCGVAFFGCVTNGNIIEEQLTFPSGTATAQLISVLHKLPPPDTTVRHRVGYTQVNSEEDGRAHSQGAHTPSTIDHGFIEDDLENEERETVEHDGWRTLSWSFSASGLLTLFAYFFPVTFTIPIFGDYLAKEWLWYFTPSLSYVGQGLLLSTFEYCHTFITSYKRHHHGVPHDYEHEPCTLHRSDVVCGRLIPNASLQGMFVGWAILSPLSKFSGWAPGPVGDMTNGARGWILWTSLGIMCADSFVSLLPVLVDYVLEFASCKKGQSAPENTLNETEAEDRLVPMTWVVGGLVSSVVVGTVLVWAVFGHDGIKPWATILGFVLGGMLSIFG